MDAGVDQVHTWGRKSKLQGFLRTYLMDGPFLSSYLLQMKTTSVQTHLQIVLCFGVRAKIMQKSTYEFQKSFKIYGQLT